MDGSGVIHVGWQRTAGFDEITVSDHGPGVPSEISDRIFEPLYTTKAKGTGLGLAICRQIVEGHGGTIHTLDTGRRGGVFRVRLPSQT
jgi:two-component system sensor histidine kinase HydH